MIDILKKTLYMGAGLAVLTKEKIEELSDKIAEDAELSEEEGRRLLGDIIEKSEKAKKELDAKIETKVKQTIEKLDIATKTDIENLSGKIERLESLIKEQSKDSDDK